MKFAKQSVEILPVQVYPSEANSRIATAARTCYKSEAKTNDSTATEFVNRLIKNKHFAMLEHGTVVLLGKKYKMTTPVVEKYERNPFSKVFGTVDGYHIIITNRRVIEENGWQQDVVNWGISDATKYDIKNTLIDLPLRVSFKVITSLQVAMQIIRHRSLSYAMESTRFCNYSKDKFSSSLTFIEPKINGWVCKVAMKTYLKLAEKLYMFLVKRNQPQIAAAILPKCTKTELVITGFVDDLEEFFAKRADEETGKVLPATKEVAEEMRLELSKSKAQWYWELEKKCD